MINARYKQDDGIASFAKFYIFFLEISIQNQSRALLVPQILNNKKE